jgi:hypothetical protein
MEGPFAPRVIRKAEICRAAPGWEVQTFINSLGGGRPITIMATVIDLAKSIFAMHGVDQAGAVYLRQPKVARAKLGAMIAALPPGMREMEACPGAHYWARQFQAQGHTVRLMAPKLVTSCCMSGKRGKNVAADAEPGHWLS